MSNVAEPTTHQFAADVNQVLSLVINSLYSNKEIFLRELVSNASDALDKLRFQALEKPELKGDDELRIRLIPNRDDNTLTIDDNGIGMTRDELVTNLGTIAHSGSREFLAKLKEAGESGDVNLIGQFGVGFYSAYLVADNVEVTTRAAGSDEAFVWKSDAKESFTIEPTERDSQGTTIVLHLGQEHGEFLEPWRLRTLVSKYSDFVSHPIELQVTAEKDGETEVGWEKINTGRPIWERPSSDVTDEQYDEFYRHLTHDWEAPLARTHFKIEGTQLFSGLLFVPKRPPFDMFDPERRHGVQLYVRRVFIMDECEEVLPKWLRFVRGVVESDDLPLNVSRELLQDSRTVRTIRNQVIKKVLDAIETVAKDDAETYATWWEKFGPVLKEGLHFEPKHKKRLADLLRYESTHGEGLTSLAEYKERMAEGQKGIYYMLGANKKLAEASPHLEGLAKRGYEVLFMTDAVDQWAVDGLKEYEEVPLISVLDAELDLEGETDSEENDEKAEVFSSLRERFTEVLGDNIQEVRLSKRLTTSPVCLVVPEGGLPSHIERLLRAQHQHLPAQKRILEINPSHPILERLNELHNGNRQSSEVADWMKLLYDQALIAEGSPIDDPGNFASRITALMTQALGEDDA